MKEGTSRDGRVLLGIGLGQAAADDFADGLPSKRPATLAVTGFITAPMERMDSSWPSDFRAAMASSTMASTSSRVNALGRYVSVISAPVISAAARSAWSASVEMRAVSRRLAASFCSREVTWASSSSAGTGHSEGPPYLPGARDTSAGDRDLRLLSLSLEIRPPAEGIIQAARSPDTLVPSRTGRDQWHAFLVA